MIQELESAAGISREVFTTEVTHIGRLVQGVYGWLD
jgi:hypothetical protein